MEAVDEITLEDVQRIAHHAGLTLWDEPNDTRNGRYRIVRGRDILHTAEDLEDAARWRSGWVRQVH